MHCKHFQDNISNKEVTYSLLPFAKCMQKTFSHNPAKYKDKMQG